MYGGVGDDEELGWKPKALPTLRAKPAMASWRKLKFLSVGKPVGLHRGCTWPKDQKPDVYFTLHCVLQIQLQATEAEKTVPCSHRDGWEVNPSCQLEGGQAHAGAPNTQVMRKPDTKSPAQR